MSSTEGKGEGCHGVICPSDSRLHPLQSPAVSISFCQHLGDSLSAIWSTSNVTGVQVSLRPGLQGSSVQQLSLLTSALPCTPATFAWFARVHAHSLSRVLLFAIPRSTARQAPLSMGILQVRIPDVLPCPPPMGLTNAGTEPQPPVSPCTGRRNLPH